MKIIHIDHSILCTPRDSLHLNSVLHVRSASENLLFIQKLTLSNDVFLTFHLFFIKH
jgi:hypothetical protein